MWLGAIGRVYASRFLSCECDGSLVSMALSIDTCCARIVHSIALLFVKIPTSTLEVPSNRCPYRACCATLDVRICSMCGCLSFGLVCLLARATVCDRMDSLQVDHLQTPLSRLGHADGSMEELTPRQVADLFPEFDESPTAQTDVDDEFEDSPTFMPDERQVIDVGSETDHDDVMEVGADHDGVMEIGAVCKCSECVRAEAPIALDVWVNDATPNLEIPNATRGGQKKETLAHVRRRLTIKTSQSLPQPTRSSTCPKTHRASPKGQSGSAAPKTHRASKNRQSGSLRTPVVIQARSSSSTRPGEAYLLQKSGAKHRYIVGMTAAKSPQYLELMTTLKDMINSGLVLTKADAIAWISKVDL